ncbi:type II CAAX prenyl endopeptidase Rce1 family protein [Spirillospora sp. NPDC048911]|uniref:CPBP family glutamic-type intramembrane protease n=1 Tax=Spirillospora sp. NPDC048911 TaxID=3364527 RepID=UPI00371A12D0
MVLSPLALAVAAYAVRGTVTGDWPAAVELGRVNGFPALSGAVGVAVLVLITGLGEETGWRGFLQSRVQERMAPMPATIVVAGVWALWHLPLFWVVESFRGFSPATLVGFLIGMMSGAFEAWAG